jgi:hypothetical protein
LIDGQTEISNPENKIDLKKGQPSAIVFPRHEVSVTAKEPSWLFKATVPIPAK